MAELRKRLETTSSKALMFVVIAEFILIFILIASGFKRVNPVFVIAGFALLTGIAYFYLKKPKPFDIYSMINKIKDYHYNKHNYPLDTSDFQVIPVTEDLVYVHLFNEDLTFEVKNKSIVGLQIRHIYHVIKEREKSRLFSESIKYIGAESRLKQQAELLGVDKSSLGLE